MYYFLFVPFFNFIAKIIIVSNWTKDYSCHPSNCCFYVACQNSQIKASCIYLNLNFEFVEKEIDERIGMCLRIWNSKSTNLYYFKNSFLMNTALFGSFMLHNFILSNFVTVQKFARQEISLSILWTKPNFVISKWDKQHSLFDDFYHSNCFLIINLRLFLHVMYCWRCYGVL